MSAICKASYYRDAPYVIHIKILRCTIIDVGLYFLEVPPLTYMPRSSTSDAVSVGTDSSEDGSISHRPSLRNVDHCWRCHPSTPLTPMPGASFSYTSFLSNSGRIGAGFVFGKERMCFFYLLNGLLISRLRFPQQLTAQLSWNWRVIEKPNV